jgi:hypothetical protein
MVLLPDRVRSDLSSVWSSPAGADSTRRGMVSAGDSLAAMAARLDSVRRDSLRRDSTVRDTGRVRP